MDGCVTWTWPDRGGCVAGPGRGGCAQDRVKGLIYFTISTQVIYYVFPAIYEMLCLENKHTSESMHILYL